MTFFFTKYNLNISQVTYPADTAHCLRSPVQQCRHDVGVLRQDGSEQLAALSAAELAGVLAYVRNLAFR